MTVTTTGKTSLTLILFRKHPSPSSTCIYHHPKRGRHTPPKPYRYIHTIPTNPIHPIDACSQHCAYKEALPEHLNVIIYKYIRVVSKQACDVYVALGTLHPHRGGI
jgi:hypothetical protein